MFYRRNRLKFICASAVVALASQAEAALISLDLTNNSLSSDRYNTGAGAFGTATSKWNIYSRGLNANNLALTDDTGAATSVSVSYTRFGSGTGNASTGAFAALGGSSIASGSVLFSGLVANGNYELAIFSSWDGFPSFTVNGVTEALNTSSTWSTLTEGVHYALFQAVADASGQLTFTINHNPASPSLPGFSIWSAFQLQDVAAPPATVPEPASLALVGIALAGLGFSQRNTKKTQ